jgi:hypothetical protein
MDTSLAASALKRFLAHAAEHLLEVVVSTRKAAMTPAYVLPELFRTLRYGTGPWYRRAFEAMIRYLGSNAQTPPDLVVKSQAFDIACVIFP